MRPDIAIDHHITCTYTRDFAFCSNVNEVKTYIKFIVAENSIKDVITYQLLNFFSLEKMLILMCDKSSIYYIVECEWNEGMRDL